MNKPLFIMVSLLLCLTMAFAGCGSQPAQESSEPAESVQSSVESEEVSEPEPVLFSNLPEKNYEGETITFLVEGDYMNTYKSVEVLPHPDSYETLNRAITDRNNLVTERFGVTFEEYRTERYGDMISILRNNSMSGVNEYDIVMPYFPEAALFAQEGGLLDLRTLDNIHYKEPYYDQGSVDDLSILGKNYFVTGDLSLLSYDVTHTLVFDKNLVQKYHLESPYDLVLSGKWTINKLWEMAKQVQFDIDGEPGMGYLDQYGFLVNNNFTSTMFIGAGQRFTVKNEKDEPTLAVYSEEAVNVFGTIYDLINDETASGKIDFTSGGYWITSAAAGKNIWEAANDSVGNGRTLFRAVALNSILKLGEYECSFGLLPAPKYTETQDRYYNRVSTIYGSCVAIPVNVKDTEMSSIILDAMMQASTKTVKTAYFDVIMKERKIQDYESEQMLDIILKTRVYEFGSIYGWGSSAHGSSNLMGFMDKIAFQGPNTFVSTWDSIKDAVQADLDATLSVYEALN